jgi:hypothetical protein
MAFSRNNSISLAMPSASTVSAGNNARLSRNNFAKAIPADLPLTGYAHQEAPLGQLSEEYSGFASAGLADSIEAA